MARARNIKPGFFLNEELGELKPEARLLFAGLWTLADREGYLEDKPKKIKLQILPYDDCDVDVLLDNLNQKGLIKRYKAAERKCIFVYNFSKHQNPHRGEKINDVPRLDNIEAKETQVGSIDKAMADTVLEQCMHSANIVQISDVHSTNPADSLKLIPDSFKLIADNDDRSGGAAPQSTQTAESKKNAFGEFGNVYLTTNEHSKLVESMGDILANDYIERLGAYIASTGRDKGKNAYKSHYATILNWVRKDKSQGGTYGDDRGNLSKSGDCQEYNKGRPKYGTVL